VTRRPQRLAAVALVGVAAAATTWWLLRIGEGALDTPPTGSTRELEAWFAEHGAPGVAMSAVRIVGLIAAAWISLAAGCVVLAELRPGRAISALSRAIAPAALRHAAQGLASATVVVGVAGVATVPAAAAPGGGPIVAADHEPPGDEPADGGGGVAILRALPDDPPGGDRPTADAAAPPLPSVETDPPPAPQPDRWIVEPGDSCWRVAEEVLAEAWGRRADVREVTAYWAELVELNADRFVTGDADLIHPGQELLLPPPPG
jgi:hypothetical protein